MSRINLNLNNEKKSDDSKNLDSGSIKHGRCNIETIKESSRFIFFVSKFFGYSLFKLPQINLKNHKICRKFTIKTTLVDFAILVTVCLVYISLTCFNSVIQFDLNMTDSLIISVGGQLCLIIGLIVSTSAIILCYVRREKVFKIFINLCYIDILLETCYDTLVVAPFNKRMTLKNHKIDGARIVPKLLDHKKHFKFSVWFLLLGLILICIDIVATYTIIKLEFNSNPLVYVSYALQNASFWMITIQTVLFLLVIRTRFTALNKLICCYLKIQDESTYSDQAEIYDLETISDDKLIYSNGSSKLWQNRFCFDRKTIAEFAQIHDKLNDIVEWINDCYAVQCLGVVTVSFGYVILTCFSLFYLVTHPKEATSKLATVYLAWFSFYVVCVISIIIASWGATTAGNRTGVLLHKSINQIMVDPDLQDAQFNEIIDSLRIFSLQLQKRSPVVSCGLFTYDWTLLFAIISSSATYLIILIQFNSSMNSLTNLMGNATFQSLSF